MLEQLGYLRLFERELGSKGSPQYPVNRRTTNGRQKAGAKAPNRNPQMAGRRRAAIIIAVVVLLALAGTHLFALITGEQNASRAGKRRRHRALALQAGFSSVVNAVVDYLRTLKLRANIETAYNEVKLENDQLVYQAMRVQELEQELVGIPGALQGNFRQREHEPAGRDRHQPQRRQLFHRVHHQQGDGRRREGLHGRHDGRRACRLHLQHQADRARASARSSTATRASPR